MACTRTVMMLWVCDSHPKMYIVRAHVQRTRTRFVTQYSAKFISVSLPFYRRQFLYVNLIMASRSQKARPILQNRPEKSEPNEWKWSLCFHLFRSLSYYRSSILLLFFFDDFFSLYAPFWMFDFSLAYLSNLTLSSVPLFTYFVVRSLRSVNGGRIS